MQALKGSRANEKSFIVSRRLIVINLLVNCNKSARAYIPFYI